MCSKKIYKLFYNNVIFNSSFKHEGTKNIDWQNDKLLRMLFLTKMSRPCTAVWWYSCDTVGPAYNE